MANFNVVMLTNGGSYGLRLLRELQQRRVPVTTVLETPPSLAGRITRSTLFTGVGDDPARAVVHWYRDKKQLRVRQQQYSEFTQQLSLTGALNSDRMQKDLHRLRPDFIVLGGMGILRESLLRLAGHGVINCHPGLLPWVRGTGVVAGAIRRGIPVGCTCHYVDCGIDTGAVIERRLLPITPRELSLSALEQGANELATCTLADIVAEQIMCGIVPAAIHQPFKFPISKWPSTEERNVIEQQVRGGRARLLFEGWRESCIDELRYQLPIDFDGNAALPATGIQSSDGRS